MSDSSFVGHEPCPDCGSSNNLARYDDGHAVCFSNGCAHYEHATGGGAAVTAASSPSAAKVATRLVAGNHEALSARKISAETCKQYDYRVGEMGGKPVQLATYYNAAGAPVAQKARFANKDFRWVGRPKGALLFGQHKFRGGGKRVVITEGEIDALSVAEALNCKWPVVSVPNGAQGAKAALAEHLEWLNGFDSIVLFFDQDEPGRTAAAECAELFAPGKACIVQGFAYKDANEALVDGHMDLLLRAQWDAQPYWPDDIVEGGTESLWERVKSFAVRTDYTYPWHALNDVTCGIRNAELVLWTAGSGIGKSHALRELGIHLRPTLMNQGLKLGIVSLEESVEITALRMAAMHLKRTHTEWEQIPEEERHAAVIEATGGCLIYDHFGSLESDRLLSKLRAMIAAGCQVIMLDHISIVISGSVEANANERRAIDVLMTNLRSLVQEKKVSIHVISHLRKAQGTAHEEGGHISLDDLRGSGSLKQLSDIIIAMERNQQADSAEERLVATLRVLKNRWTGTTGPAGWLTYNAATTRYTEVVDDPFAEEECGTNKPDSGGAGF